MEKIELNKEQKALYRSAMEQAHEQLGNVDQDMEKELEKARARLVELQESKKIFKQIYECTAVILGVNAELIEVSEDKISPVSKADLLQDLS